MRWSICAWPTGTPESFKSITRDDLVAFHRDFFRPDNATITAALDKALGDWTAPSSPLPRKQLSDIASHAEPRAFLIDRKGAQQSVIGVGVLATPTGAPSYLSGKMANDVFGGGFTSRINLNLREDKIRANRERKLPGAYERADAVLGVLESNQVYRRPDDYVVTLKAAIEAQTQAKVADAAKRLFVPRALTWVVIGDLSKIEAGVRALNIGPIAILDQDGKVVR